jgi:hypothetical protein
MSDIIEVIAEAICEGNEHRGFWDHLADGSKSSYRHQATIVLTAVKALPPDELKQFVRELVGDDMVVVPREPTEEMILKAVDRPNGQGSDSKGLDIYVEIYKAMISAQQGEKT